MKKEEKGYLGFSEYEYPLFLPLGEIYTNYKKWIYHNHTQYYDKIGMNSWCKSPDKIQLGNKISTKYGPLIKDPSAVNGLYGFNNIKFK